MNDDLKFERNARAWLEIGPTIAPERAIDAALTTIETTSQQRNRRVPWRLPSLKLSAGFATAGVVAIVVIAAGFLLLRNQPATVGGPSPTATADATTSPAPSASLSASSDLSHEWLVFERRAASSDDASVPPLTRLWAVRGDGTQLHEVAPDLPESQSPYVYGWSDSTGAVRTGAVFESSGTSLGELGDGSRLWIGPVDHDPFPGVIQVPCDTESPADCEELNPAFSRDGTRLAFIQHNLKTGTYVVGVRNPSPAPDDFTFLESTREKTLTPTHGRHEESLGRPSWSPDGAQIVYQRTNLWDSTAVSSEIYVVDTDDTDNRRLPTPADSGYAEPDWSPDGSMILLSDDPDRYYGRLSSGIYTMDPQTGVLTELCHGLDCGRNPSWTSDGRQILARALNAGADGTWALMDAGGGDMVPINPDLDVYTTEAGGGFVVRMR